MSLLTTSNRVVAALAPLRGKALRFAAVGVGSTVAYSALFLLLHPLGAQAANALALLLTAMANTAANRAFTFGVKGRSGVWRHQVQGLLVFGVGLAITSGSLATLHASTPDPTRAAELAVLVLANLVATVTRFMVLHRWVFATAA